MGCANRNRQQVITRSTSLGFLTGMYVLLMVMSVHLCTVAWLHAAVLPIVGDESGIMLDAHTEAGFLVGVPFAGSGVYDFATHGDKTRQVARLGAVMLQVTAGCRFCLVTTDVHCKRGRRCGLLCSTGSQHRQRRHIPYIVS